MTPKNFIDLTGEKFGHLTVVKRTEDKVLSSGVKKAQWLCQCDCGKQKSIIGESIRNGTTKSCGCHRGDSLVLYSTKHGKRYERIYDIFCGIKKRCYNENCINFKNYGGRGIEICDEWLNDFQRFYDWSIEHGYNDTLTIDRIDNDGNYEPSNCQWITKSENTRKRNIEYWRKVHENKIRAEGDHANASV